MPQAAHQESPAAALDSPRMSQGATQRDKAGGDHKLVRTDRWPPARSAHAAIPRTTASGSVCVRPSVVQASCMGGRTPLPSTSTASLPSEPVQLHLAVCVGGPGQAKPQGRTQPTAVHVHQQPAS